MSARAPLRKLGQLAARVSALALVVGCTETLDAGRTRPHALLPIDEHNPLVVVNDGATDNWQGEYALLLAHSGGPRLAELVVVASGAWPDLDENVAGWSSLVAAARQSGLDNVPDPTPSASENLVPPANGSIEDTVPTRSHGAQLILDRAAELGLPNRPLVVATGTRLTDVANAYLLDPSVAERIIVVSSLGALNATGATMSNPNGEMDPWADFVVSTRLRYVQVSAYYDQSSDVPDARVSELPDNAFGAWMAAKQPHIYSIEVASDQVSVLASALPPFVRAVTRVEAPGAPLSNGGPDLVAAPHGPGWLVTRSDGPLATSRLWELLGDPATFGN